jgi:hypothetical protein
MTPYWQIQQVRLSERARANRRARLYPALEKGEK